MGGAQDTWSQPPGDIPPPQVLRASLMLWLAMEAPAHPRISWQQPNSLRAPWAEESKTMTLIGGSGQGGVGSPQGKQLVRLTQDLPGFSTESSRSLETPHVQVDWDSWSPRCRAEDLLAWVGEPPSPLAFLGYPWREVQVGWAEPVSWSPSAW